ncbi:ferric reductase-like transmembrane domain-containing protein [Patescibacteria group bacterium]|nr:ferric reductase-like transmembrane domain-containing protein [Patescibacteria group bacterium]
MNKKIYTNIDCFCFGLKHDTFWCMKKVLIYFLFFINLAIVIGIWINGSGILLNGSTGDIFIALGRLVGLLAMFFILVQLVLIGRIRWIEQQFGFDNLNILHKKIGFSIGATILLHPFFIILGYSIAGRISYFEQISILLSSWPYVLLAAIGLTILLLCVGISISIVRKKLKYETWYFTHLFIYVAIGLVFAHQIQTADVSFGWAKTYWLFLNFIVFGLVLLYRFIRPIYLTFKHQFYIDRIVTETDSVTSFYIKGKHINKYFFQPGQYMHIIFLAKKMWYSHPFSFSTAPNSDSLRVSIKSSGDFTSTIHKVPVGTHVIIDGPFGIFTEKTAKYDAYLFIAGGIGITPIRSLIESLSAKNKDMILLYGNRTEKDIAFRSELENMNVKIHHVLSETNDPKFETGYMDNERIVRLAPDFMKREIFVCGPPVMMNAVVKLLKEMGVPKSQLHYEVFSY